MILDIVKHAKQLLYDNSKSKLNSTDVQGAIDELNNSTGELSSSVSELTESVDELNESLKTITFATEEPTSVPENTIVMVYEV